MHGMHAGVPDPFMGRALVLVRNGGGPPPRRDSYPVLCGSGARVATLNEVGMSAEPTRPERPRRPPERLGYASAALTTARDACCVAKYDITSPRIDAACLQVDTSHGADRIIQHAKDLYAHGLCTHVATMTSLS